ncbi:uncharacterized protein LOC124174084 [Ischnura elegans]|uniref:uncharacterized protein LOC124174084 n=1 Tax=Ischnura elegans TaxID=197161 RepID=UPI001ED88FF3|nr:uncharacterized protein LOC124174084 [Ischnura elegans]
MMKIILVLGLAAVALCQERIYPVVSVNFGSVGITHVELRGSLLPTISRSGVPTIVFRTKPQVREDLPGDFLVFRCNILDDSFVTKSGAMAMFCRGNNIQRGNVLENMSFVFSADGLSLPAEERSVELMLERDVVNGFVTLPGTIIGTTILGDHA